MKYILLTILIPMMSWAQFSSETKIEADEIRNNTAVDILLNPTSTVKVNNFTGGFALQSGPSKELEESAITNTELNYLDGTTSNVQTQIDAKQDTLTGTDGDLFYWNSGLANLGIGTNGQYLRVSALGFPEWADFPTVSPLTTKGDIYTFDTDNQRLPVGADSQILSANSATPTGLEWIDPPTTSPTTTLGDIIYNNTGTAGDDTRLPIGTENQLLTVNGGLPSWQDAPVSTTLDTKGQLQGYSTQNEAVPAPTQDGQFLVSDSAEATGLKWDASLQSTLNAVTNWQDFTLVPTNGITLGNATFGHSKYRRIGDSVEVSFRLIFGTTTSINGDVRFEMPNSLIKDSSKISGGTATPLGRCELLDSGTEIITGRVANSGINNEVIIRSIADNAAAVGVRQNVLGTTLPFTWSTGDEINCSYSIPVQGWSSGVNAVVQNQTIDVPVVEEWQDGTCTSNWGAGMTVQCKYRRVGDTAEVNYITTVTGSLSAVNLTLSPPSEFSVDAVKITGRKTGSVQIAQQGVREWIGSTFWDGSNFRIISTDSANAGNVSPSFPFAWSSGDNISATITMPVVGWSATEPVNAVIAGNFEQIEEVTPVQFRVVNAGVQTIGAGITETVSFGAGTIVLDTAGNGLSGNSYIIPKDGIYNINCSVGFDGGSSENDRMRVQITTSGDDAQMNCVFNRDGFSTCQGYLGQVQLSQGNSVSCSVGNDSAAGLGIVRNNAFTYMSIEESLSKAFVVQGGGGSFNSPLTTSGDILSHNGTTDVRVPVGSDGSFLVADSTETNGIKWSNALSGTLNPVTDWEEFTPTYTNVTVGTGAAAATDCKKRRIGDSQHVQCRLQLGVGGSVSGTIYLTLPEPADISKLNRSSFARLDGFVRSFESGVGVQNMGEIILNNTSTTQIYFTHNGADPYNATQPFNWGENDELFVDFNYPVQGWSSGLDAAVANNLLDASSANELSAKISSGFTVNWQNYDGFLSGNCTNPATGRVVCPVNSGVFTQLPVCVVAQNNGVGNAHYSGSFSTSSSTITSLEFNFSDFQGIAFNPNNGFNFICSKQGADVNKSQIIAGTFEQIQNVDVVKTAENTDHLSARFNDLGGNPLQQNYKMANGDNWITCTRPATGSYDCAFASGLFTSAPMVHISVRTGSGTQYIANPNVVSTTQLTFQVTNLDYVVNNVQFEIIASKDNPDVNASIKGAVVQASSLAVECQTKFLNSDITSDSPDITDLKFNNLTVGKNYYLTSQVLMRKTTTGSPRLAFTNNGNVIARAYNTSTTGEAGWNTFPNAYFTAEATTVITQLFGGASTTIFGDGSRVETFATLCELPDNYILNSTKFN